MYVCVCNAVTDHEIEQVVRDGVRTMTQLEEALLVGTCCGKCRETAQECLSRFTPQRPTLVRSA